MCALIKAKQIDIASLTTALGINTIARQAISVASGSLLSYNSTTGVLDYQGYISSRTIHVDKDNPRATNTRTSISKYNYDKPFLTIQAAINVAVTGDLIYISSHTDYTENLNFSTNDEVYVVQFDGVILNGNITLTNDLSNTNLLIFNNASVINGNVLINTNSNATLLSDGTATINGYLNRLNTPTSTILLQGFKLINSASNYVYSGGTTFRATPEIYFKNIELIRNSHTAMFLTGNLKFDNVNVYHDNVNATDAIFSNGGISGGAIKSNFESKLGVISSGVTYTWFYGIYDCTFKAPQISFDIKASSSTNKIMQFFNCTFLASKEVFVFATTANGKLLLNNCTVKLSDTARYIVSIVSGIVPTVLEANNIIHNSVAGFYSAVSYPETYTENNILKVDSL